MVLHEQAEPDFVREHDIDHVTLDIIENALKNIRHEMDRVLVTTAVSPVIREQADEFPLIADRKGRMVVGQFGSPVDTVLENSPYTVEDLKDGDVIALNDPYMMEGSTSHLLRRRPHRLRFTVGKPHGRWWFDRRVHPHRRPLYL
jgi:N-methylhydantoinase B